MAFSFGAPPAAASTSTSAAPTNSFSFGQSQPQQQQPPSGPSGFSFGNQNQNQQPQQQQQQTASSGFSFAPKPPATIPTGPSNPTPSFSFNNNNNNSNTTTNTLNQSQPNQFSFGQSTSSQPNQPQPPQQQTQNGFNNNNNNNNNNSSLSTSLSVQNPNNKRLGLPLSTEIDRIRSAWDTNNLQTCRFLAYFYNSVPPQQIRAISDGLNGNGSGNQNGRNANLNGNGAETEINYNTGRRFDAVGQRHENLWAQAVMECPDRENLLPVLALGFPDLQKRIQAQSSESIRQYQHLQTLTKRLSDLTQRHDLSNIVRIKSSANKQKELHQSLISMVRKSSKLIGSLKNSGIERKEEELRNRLEGLEGELNGVGGGGRGGNFGNGIGGGNRGDHGNSGERLNPRINDLWASLSTAKISKAENRDGNGNGQEANLEWAMVDEDKLNEVTRILGSQQQGLSHLLKTLDSDNKSIDVVLKGLEGVGMIGR